ncbi:positive regulation of actin filament bundle assembly [Mactra antiquata]
MVTGERLTLTLKGGAPWGFRLQGGGNFPLEVAKIRKNSHSYEAGLKEGDVILSINGHPMSGKAHASAMEIVEMSSGSIVFEVTRPPGGRGATKPMDPQRVPRPFPGAANADQGVVRSSHQHSFNTFPRGHTRTDRRVDEYVTPFGDGQRSVKTFSEQRVTRYDSGSIGSGMSPAVSHTSVTSGEHKSRSPARSPNVWQPPSRSNLQKSQSTLDISFGHRKKSPVPDQWQPRSLSPAPGSHSSGYQLKPTSSRSSRSGRSSSVDHGAKENYDPFILREQKKWEASHIDIDPPKFRYDSSGQYRTNARYAAPKMDDPKYPMFELPPATKWVPPKINEPPVSSEPTNTKKWAPPVPPKPTKPAYPQAQFDPAEAPVAGSSHHRPGMIRPPAQSNLMPAPPPPPLPPSPNPDTPRFNVVPITSKLGIDTHVGDLGYDEPDPTHRPDHLPVFAPRVVFAPDEDSGMVMSPDRTDVISDISSHKKKLFSDSAFYDDSTNRYPTIDEQMSMCKKIAQSLTSFANNRARGARMFAKRKRKANKWIHDLGSEFSSSAGDVADLNDLDSELLYDEGGNKPLFSFRIPKVAGQITSGQKMSLSKEEFERLRLAAPKVDHHGVSPNMCFNIAADLHKGGRNKGAKLFQKRQQRVEKFVIDDSNVLRSPVSPSTKLDYIVQNPEHMKPQKSPWNAAATGDVNNAFKSSVPSMPLQPIPKHNLAAENQPRILGGGNYNTKARGWAGSGPGGQQQSYYRESYDPSTGTSRKEWHQESTSEQTFIQDSNPATLDQYGNYNRRIRAWPEPEKVEKKPVEFGDYNRKVKAWPEPENPPPKQVIEHGDYNRRMQAWSGSGQSTLPKKTVQTSINVQTNYNSLPKGFGSSKQQTFHQRVVDVDDLPGSDM